MGLGRGSVTLPSVVLSAALDRRLHPGELRLYVFLHGELDSGSFRPIKHLWAAHQLGLARESLARAMGRLVRLGYLRRGKMVDGLRTYRIVPSLTPLGSTANHKRERRAASRMTPLA